jgi:hypothetical protein
MYAVLHVQAKPPFHKDDLADYPGDLNNETVLAQNLMLLLLEP